MNIKSIFPSNLQKNPHDHLLPLISTDPYVILDPSTRWIPGDVDIRDARSREKLIPPLVHLIKCGVKEWRNNDYHGISTTSRALLTHWFHTDYWIGSHTTMYMAWAETIRELHDGLVEQGHRLLAQFDVTATPKHSCLYILSIPPCFLGKLVA